MPVVIKNTFKWWDGKDFAFDVVKKRKTKNREGARNKMTWIVLRNMYIYNK